MIAAFADDTCPRIARHEGQVAILASDEGEDHGFLLRPGAAYQTAVKILAAIADIAGDDAFSHAVEAIRFQVLTRRGQEGEGHLTFRVEGAPLSAHLNATQVAELAAAFTAASNYIDRPDRLPDQGHDPHA